ncbi:hypothetical protein [Bradyrhizobium sp. LCT2]|uniref:hypothetical protein n=1 Tax=Bradyrhizobium sp. LCT2 TaxID=2493093 RepID=UPI00352DDAA2
MIQVPTLHHVRHLIERCLLVGGHRLTGHHLLDLATVFLHELAGDSLSPEQERKQSITLMLGSDLAPPEKIALAYNADEIIGRIHDR